MQFPTVSGVLSITVEQMREVDRLQVEQMGIGITMMMENASRATAAVARHMLGGDVVGKRIVILCGRGNNGGDGIAAARHLTNWGAQVDVVLTAAEDRLREIPKQQLAVLHKMHVGCRVFDPAEDTGFDTADLLIDALVGYDLTGNPREPMAALIRTANSSSKPILAMDIPSGLEGNSGSPGNPTIFAAATLTLALPKTGLVVPAATKYVGTLYLADLSVPQRVYETIGIEVPYIFRHCEIVAIAT